MNSWSPNDFLYARVLCLNSAHEITVPVCMPGNERKNMLSSKQQKLEQQGEVE